jgi:ferredoxin
MAHRTAKEGYELLVNRLNKFPQGVVPSETLYEILKVMFSEEESRKMSLLPIGYFNAALAAKKWKISKDEAEKILNDLASRAVLIDIEYEGECRYVLPPPVIGFFEFSMMRVGGKLDQKVLSELFNQYIGVEDEFVKKLLTIDTPMGRAFVREEAIPDNSIYVLDYEKATSVIKKADHIAVSTCFCRHVKSHLGEACDAPLETCITLGNGGKSLVKHGYAKKIELEEALEILEDCKNHNLVQFGENVQNKVGFLCNCCSCCCEVLSNARKFGVTKAINTSNFISTIIDDNCTGCGKCVNVCPVEALSLVSKNLPISNKKIAKVDVNTCIGCGVCERVCEFDALVMKQREKRVFTPVDLNHKLVLQGIETGTLPNLIFKDQAKFSHRLLASILGVILKLPPAKQLLASKQLKSRYLKKQINRLEKDSKK